MIVERKSVFRRQKDFLVLILLVERVAFLLVNLRVLRLISSPLMMGLTATIISTRRRFWFKDVVGSLTGRRQTIQDAQVDRRNRNFAERHLICSSEKHLYYFRTFHLLRTRVYCRQLCSTFLGFAAACPKPNSKMFFKTFYICFMYYV